MSQLLFLVVAKKLELNPNAIPGGRPQIVRLRVAQFEVDGSVCCSCDFFERVGILCRNILDIFHLLIFPKSSGLGCVSSTPPVYPVSSIPAHDKIGVEMGLWNSPIIMWSFSFSLETWLGFDFNSFFSPKMVLDEGQS
jgi:hypothetical protein